MKRKVIYIHILQTRWLLAWLMNNGGRRCVPEALTLTQASVSLSLAFWKFAACVLPAVFKDVKGINQHHNPV